MMQRSAEGEADHASSPVPLVAASNMWSILPAMCEGQRTGLHSQCHVMRPQLWCRYTFVTLDP